jgi:hypothetical protein
VRSQWPTRFDLTSPNIGGRGPISLEDRLCRRLRAETTFYRSRPGGKYTSRPSRGHQSPRQAENSTLVRQCHSWHCNMGSAAFRSRPVNKTFRLSLPPVLRVFQQPDPPDGWVRIRSCGTTMGNRRPCALGRAAGIQFTTRQASPAYNSAYERRPRHFSQMDCQTDLSRQHRLFPRRRAIPISPWADLPSVLWLVGRGHRRPCVMVCGAQC